MKPQKKKKWTPSRNHWTLLACRKKAQTKIETDQNNLKKESNSNSFKNISDEVVENYSKLKKGATKNESSS